MVGWLIVLYDECDILFGLKVKEYEEICGVINVSYCKGVVVGCCVICGKIVEIEELLVYCVVVLVGFDDLFDIIMFWLIVVRMCRRVLIEFVELWCFCVNGFEVEKLYDWLVNWVVVINLLESGWLVMLDGVIDWCVDVWEFLVVVVDIVGGYWFKIVCVIVEMDVIVN